MVLCQYKKTFLKDLAKIHPDYQEKIRILMFAEIWITPLTPPY